MAVSKFRKLVNSIVLINSRTHFGLKYSRSNNTVNNWGDALNRYLIPKVSGKEIVYCTEYFNTGLNPTLCAIGSILDKNRIRNLYVWGTGLMSPDSIIPVLPKKIFAVRGRLTQKRLTSLNVRCPDVFGDPAIILPRFYQPPRTEKKYKLGVVPHYVDKTVESINPLLSSSEVCVIDIESGIEEFVNKICECEVIASSSLHGLIAADAYGIPRVWLKLSDKISGGEFKFQDYFSTTDIKDITPLTLESISDHNSILRRAVRPQRMADVDELIRAFPF